MNYIESVEDYTADQIKAVRDLSHDELVGAVLELRVAIGLMQQQSVQIEMATSKHARAGYAVRNHMKWGNAE